MKTEPILINKLYPSGELKSQETIGKSLVIIFIVILLITSGCSIRLTKINSEDTRLQKLTQKKLSEISSIKIIKSDKDPNIFRISQINNSKIELLKPCRIKYQSFYFDLVGLVAVTGTLPPNSKKYTVFLDTGHHGYVMTNSLTVLENNLTICSLYNDNAYQSYKGICEIPSIRLGQAIITDPPCVYLQQQWEVRLLSLPIWQQRGVLLGLSLLKDFSYIEFDNPKKEIELSLTKMFEPNHPDKWDNYPFEIKNERLIVRMPIDGQNFPMMFDSCGRYGMVVKQNFFENVPLKAKSGKIKDGKFQSGFLGELSCQRTKVKKLNIGNMNVRNAEILILSDESRYTEVASSISMKFFRKTVVVLDFKNGLMWVKK